MSSTAVVGGVRWRPFAANAALLAASTALCLALVEGALCLVLAHPRLLGAPGETSRLLRTARQYYVERDRRCVHMSPASARWDPDLFYTLRPGRFSFANREFAVEYRVDSAGLRDDEDSLRRPRVVVLGDSQALGWGVPQEACLAAELERRLGRKVLNAAQASYGTARELMLLRRLDVSACDLVLIQYCDNDWSENADFLRGGGRLTIGPEAEYEEWCRRHARELDYYPGKHLAWWVAHVLGTDPAGRPAPPTPEVQAAAFLDVLAESHDLLLGRRVVVFEVNGHDGSTERWSRAVNELLARGKLPEPLARSVSAVAVASCFGPDDRFVLDDHLTASGQSHLAEALARHLGEGR